MAYGLKYSSTAYGLSSSQWKVEILEKNYTPAVGETPVNLKLVGEGVTIGYDREEDRFNNIYSRYAIIDLKVTDSFNLDTLQFDDERKFLIKVFKSDVLEFVGWLIPNYSSQAYEDVKITTITIQAKDSINRLNDISFVDEHPTDFSNKQSVQSLISQALRQIGYNLDLEIYYNKYEDGMLKTVSDCPLSQLYINVKSFVIDNESISYYEVLERLLNDHDLRIFQSNGKWMVISPIEVVDGVVTGRKFNYLGVKQTPNVTLNTDFSIGGGSIGILSNSIIRKGIPVQSYSAKFNFGQSRNLVYNGILEEFLDYQPEGWTLSNNWENGEVAENAGGGIIFQNTYTTRTTTDPSAPINDASLLQNKYLESSQINIERLGTFSLSAETFISADIDAVRVRVEFYNEGGANKQYIGSDGKLTFVPTSIYVYNNEEDSFRLLTLTWENKNQYGTPVAFKYMKVRIYEGIRLRAGVPVSTEVKYKNIKIAGRPIDVSGEFIGKRVDVKNNDLPNSKKYTDLVYYYKDAVLFKEPEHIHKFYLSNEVGEADATTGKWKRTLESTQLPLIESRLVDRLSMSNRFGDIFEGSISDFISLWNTPFLNLDNKRLLLLYSEYRLQSNTTEIVAVELFANSVSVDRKEFNLFSDDIVIEVDTDAISTTKVNAGEKFDIITSAGGTMYGGVYIDKGIDAIPVSSTDPRATNKGLLTLGAVNAQNIELGNFANNTLVEILGRFGIRNSNNYLAQFSVADLTADRVITVPDRDINLGDYNSLINTPDYEANWQQNWNAENAKDNLLLSKIGGNTVVRGDLILRRGDGDANFDVPLLDGDRYYTFPNASINVNDFNDLFNKPTTIAGYGITDFVFRFNDRWNEITTELLDLESDLSVGGNLYVYTNSLFSGPVQFDAIPSCSVSPSSTNHLVNKGYVDSLSFVKKGENVKTISFSSLTKSGLYTVNGYALQSGDLVLDASNTTGSGVWVASAGAWSRSTNNDTDAEIRGVYHLVTAGDYINQRYINSNTSAIELDTTPITYTLDFGAEADPVWNSFKVANNITTTRIGNWNTAFGWGNHANLYVDKVSTQNDIAGAKTFTTSVQSPILRAGTSGLNITMFNHFGTQPRIASSGSILDFFTGTDFTWTTTGDFGRMKLNTTGLRVGSSNNPVYTLHVSGTTGLGGLLHVVNPINGTFSSGTEGQVLMRRSVSGLNYDEWATLTVARISDIAETYQAKITGTTNYLTKKTAGNFGDSQLFDDGTYVVVGGTTPIDSSKFSVAGRIGSTTLRIGDNSTGIDISGLVIASTGALGHNATSYTWNVSSTEKMSLNGSRLALNGNLELIGNLKVNDSWGQDHYFLKSLGVDSGGNPMGTEWAIMNVGEISDIDDVFASKTYADQNYVKRITDEGERGFYLYGDTANEVKEALFFSNPDTGVVGIHGFRLNGSAVEQYGFQLDKDGLPYWLFADGNRKRILTEGDSAGGSGSWNGGVVKSTIDIRTNANAAGKASLKFSHETNTSIGAEMYLTSGFLPFNGMVISSNRQTDLYLVAGYDQNQQTFSVDKNIYLYGAKIYFGNVEIDMSTFGPNKYLRAVSSTKAEWVV